MRDDFTKTWFPEGQDPAAYDPVRSARGAMKPRLPKRFYADVSIAEREGGFSILLDGRPARTRAKALLALATRSAAEFLAEEWRAQGEFIDPATMPVTRIAHAGIDHVAVARADVIEDILRYAGSDLTCYRAADPEGLVEMQARLWDPVLAHAKSRYGAAFLLSEGIRFVEQPEASISALRPRIEAVQDAIAMAGLHVLTTISGSALIAIAVADRVLDGEAGFAAGEADSDFEASIWGHDEEAAARRVIRLADFRAACTLFHALEG